MFQIISRCSATGHKNVHGNGFPSGHMALAYVEERMGKIVMAEEDADHPGFYDIFLSDGRLLVIEPEEAGEA